MKLSSPPRLKREFEAAIQVALEAGVILLRYQTDMDVSGEKVWEKDRGELVSEADVTVNKLLVAELRKRFPDDGIVAEESVELTQLHHDRVWYVDPLDGTKEYLDGRDDFSCMIGLAIDGEPVLGVVFQPRKRQLSYAIDSWGEVVTLKSFDIDEKAPSPKDLDIDSKRELAVNASLDLTKLTLVCSRSHRPAALDPIKETLGISRELRRGSVGVKVTMLACGEADLYLHPAGGTKFWDTCAPQALINAAGGKITDLAGTELVYRANPLPDDEAEIEDRPLHAVTNLTGFVASNGVHHDRFLEAVQKAMNIGAS